MFAASRSTAAWALPITTGSWVPMKDGTPINRIVKQDALTANESA